MLIISAPVFRRSVIFILAVSLLFPTVGAYASSAINVQPSARLVMASLPYDSVLIKGIEINPNNLFELKFILEQNKNKYSDSELRKVSEELVRYFLAALTIPAQDLWVNLSPHEKNRVISANLEKTDIGKVMLEQDYLLKQLATSLTYPETEQGKRYWDESSVSDLNRVWIVPDKAVVVEEGNSAVIKESLLAVKMEKDNPSFKKNILPLIKNDVNAGKNFASLRQIYNALILANWFKKKVRDSIFGEVYLDKSKTAGIEHNEMQIKEKVYERYLEAFKNGAYDYTKTERIASKSISRRYFSGGEDLTSTEKVLVVEPGDVEDAKSGLNGPASVKVELAVASGAGVHRMNYSPVRGRFYSPIAVRKKSGQDMSFVPGELDMKTLKRHVRALDIADYSDVNYVYENSNRSFEALIDDDLVASDQDIAAVMEDIARQAKAPESKKAWYEHDDGLTVLFVDKSPTLAETHLKERIILINRAINKIPHEGVRDVVELWLIYHGLYAIVTGQSGDDFEEEQATRDAFYIMNLCRSSGLPIKEFLETMKGINIFNSGDIVGKIERMISRANVLSEETQDRVIEGLRVDFESGRGFDAVLMGHAHADPFSRQLLADVISGRDNTIRLGELIDSFQGQVAMYRRDVKLIREACAKQQVAAIGVEQSSESLEQIARSYQTDMWAIKQHLKAEGVLDLDIKADDIFLYFYGPVIYLKLTDNIFAKAVKLFALDDQGLVNENRKSFGRCHGKLMIFVVEAQMGRINEDALRNFQVFINAGDIFDRKETARALSVFDGNEKLKKMARQLTGLMRKFRKWSRERSKYMTDKIVRAGQLRGGEGAIMAVFGKAHLDDVKAILTGHDPFEEAVKPPKSSRKSSGKMRVAKPVEEDTGGVDWRKDDFVAVETRGAEARFNDIAIDPATFKGFTFQITSLER